MENIITNEPNDTIAILCKRHNNENNTYILNPLEVSFGKINDNGIFQVENGGDEFHSVDDYDSLVNDNIEMLYAYPVSVYELQEYYPDVDNLNLLMLKYFKDIASNISIAIANSGEVRIYENSYKVISPEIGGDVSKKIDDNYDELYYDDEEEKVDNNLNKDYEHAANVQKKQINPLIDPIDIDDFINYMKNRIVGNDETIEDICTTIVMNIIAKDSKYVKNLLSIGPTGSGKSQSWKDIASYLAIPTILFDCNSLSSAGYVGDSIEDYLRTIYLRSDSNLKLANKAIMVLDEIDKLGSNNTLDIKQSAQDSLLKVIEGHAFEVEVDKSRGKTVTMDTTGMTIVGCGAFSSIFDERRGDIKKNKIGFNTDNLNNKTILKADDPKMLAEVTDEELKNFGFKSEFIPRFHKRNVYRELDRDGLRLALTTSDNSALIQTAQEYLDEFNCSLDYDDAFIEAIVEEAYSLKCGGRSLNRITALAFKYADKAILSATKCGTDIVKKRVLKLSGDTVKNPKNFDLK